MPFAAVTNVNLEGRDQELAEKLLREGLVPMMKAQPGFQSARFLRSQDGKSGVGAVLFDTESHAKAGLDAMVNNRPAEAPPVEGTAIYEVVLEV
jgi:heme-degrading monooxygenase HmoA